MGSEMVENDDDRGAKRPRKDDFQAQTRKALEEMRRRVRAAGASQREVERRAGFSKGYLSQLLAGKVDLKVWHVLAILDAVGGDPRDYFLSAFAGARRRFPALERFRKTSQPLSAETDEILDKLYGGGVESLNELRDRLSRCERAVSELEEKGLLDSWRNGNGGDES